MAAVPISIIDPWYDVPERSKVRIHSKDVGGVTGLVQEQFRFNWDNDYKQPFADMLASFNTGVQAGQDLVNAVADRQKATNWTPTLQELKKQLWAGSTTLRFDLNLFYFARRGALLDVVNPIKRLTALSAPRTAVRTELIKGEEGRALTATVVNRPPLVQIEIGYILRLKRALIRSVVVEFPTNVTDVDGQPNEAMVSLGIESDRMFLSDDTEVDFIGGEVNRWVGDL